MGSMITVDLSPELKERLERYAKETNQNPSSVASSVLASFLEDEEAHLACTGALILRREPKIFRPTKNDIPANHLRL